MTTYALQRDRRQASPDDFPQQLAELLGHLEDDLPRDHPFARLARLAARPPGGARALAARLLPPERRSGRRSSASRTRSPTSSTATAPQIATDYLRALRSRASRLAAPRVAVATWALAADTEEEAWRLAAS